MRDTVTCVHMPVQQSSVTRGCSRLHPRDGGECWWFEPVTANSPLHCSQWTGPTGPAAQAHTSKVGNHSSQDPTASCGVPHCPQTERHHTHLGHLDLLLGRCGLNGLGHLHALARAGGHNTDHGDRLCDGDGSTLACKTAAAQQLSSTGRDHQSDERYRRPHCIAAALESAIAVL